MHFNYGFIRKDSATTIMFKSNNEDFEFSTAQIDAYD